MNQDTVIADIERKAGNAGLTIREVCIRAEVHPTTFSRWKRSEKNPEPMGASLLAIGRIYAAIDELARERSRKTRRKAVAA